MGEVYRARDTRLDRVVAIKTLAAHLSNEPESRERFEREARAVSALNHPHICVLFDIGRQDQVDFLVMEFLEGGLRFGIPKPLFDSVAVAPGHTTPYHVYAVSADGQRFLIPRRSLASADDQETPLTVVLNWTAPLGKK